VLSEHPPSLRPVASSPTRTPGIDDLRVLYDLHGSEIFRFCHRLVGDRGLAEEAMQETFLRAWRSSDRWDPATGSVRTWMYAVARNVCIDALRSRGRRIGLTADATDAVAAEQPGLVDDTGFDSVLSSWMLEEALRRLPAEQRDALVLTYVRDRPYAEIASALSIPEATLRTRVFYGLKSLRKILDEMGWHE
jgi:RNA polymerase sigma-70 factor, ECF subfamily